MDFIFITNIGKYKEIGYQIALSLYLSCSGAYT